MELNTINRRIENDAATYLAECDVAYAGRVNKASALIAGRLRASNLVFLSGPSGSGKTTTAKKLELALQARGIGTHVISMDCYFLDEPLTRHLVNEVGDRDYESPECLDLPLLREHFHLLSQGDEVTIPYFSFKNKRRNPDKAQPLRLAKDEVAIFEGIHALNPTLYAHNVPDAFKLYISTRTDITHNGKVLLKHTLLRLLRRVVRDHNFRGADIATTLAMWDGVRRGELKYISPYKDLADYQFDTAHDYEVAALRPFAQPLFDGWPVSDIPRRGDFCHVTAVLPHFAPVDEPLISKSSLLREFIGGGDLKY